MRSAALATCLILVACGPPVSSSAVENAGVALERAAVARGLVADPAKVDPIGLYTSDSDSLCVVPAGGGYRVGASIDYGEGQGCSAAGTASGHATLAIRFGDACRLTARIEGDRVSFPATVPAGCDRFCTGRASLAALTADRVSGSAAEAESAVTPAGGALCARPRR